MPLRYSAVRQWFSKPETVAANMLPDVVGSAFRPGWNLRQSIVSRMRDASWAHWRSCQPATIAGLDAPSAMSTPLPVDGATRGCAQGQPYRAAGGKG